MALKDVHPVAFGNGYSRISIEEKEKVDNKSFKLIL